MPASRHQDHTTSPSAFAPFVLRRQSVHRIPRPTFRDDREAPLLMGATMRVIWGCDQLRQNGTMGKSGDAEKSCQDLIVIASGREAIQTRKQDWIASSLSAPRDDGLFQPRSKQLNPAPNPWP